MRNFNEIFRKDGTYDNIKSHKKSEEASPSLSRRYIFGKTEERRGSHQGLNHLLTLMYTSLHYSIVK